MSGSGSGRDKKSNSNKIKWAHTKQKNKTNSSARHVIIYGLQCIEQRTVDSIKLCSESNGRVGSCSSHSFTRSLRVRAYLYASVCVCMCVRVALENL